MALNCAGVLGLSCEALATNTCRGFTRQLESPNVHMSGSRPSKTPPKFHERTPREKKERKLWRESEKKSENLGGLAGGPGGKGPTLANLFLAILVLAPILAKTNLNQSNIGQSIWIWVCVSWWGLAGKGHEVGAKTLKFFKLGPEGCGPQGFGPGLHTTAREPKRACTFQGPGLQKQHQNCTKGPPE